MISSSGHHREANSFLANQDQNRRAMAGYETLTITAPNDILRLSSPQLGSGGLNPSHPTGQGARDLELGHQMDMPMGVGVMDAFDQALNFEGEGLLDDVSGMPTLPFTPSYELDAFSSTFEDPFSYQSDAFSSVFNTSADQTNNPTSTSNAEETENPDNKLLSFGAPIPKAAILDDSGQTWPAMSAELYGMFFVAEDVFGDSNTPAGRPMELTCYRRNLFQISGNVTLSRGIKAVINEQGQQIPLYDLTATISAIESIEGKATEIISVPWKTSTAATAEDKAGAAPPKWPLDLSMNPELDPTCVSIPIAWKRLQFKHATANNGRRKGLQQHYVIQINLMATLATGETVKLTEIQSGPIIVRGRSPRNFDSRKDVPLSERKLEPKQRSQSDAAREPPLKVDPGVSNGNYKFYALNALQQPLDLPDWNTSNPAPLPSPSSHTPTPLYPSKKPTLTHSSSSNSIRPPVPKTKWRLETTPTKPAQAPIDLSLNDDEYGRSLSVGGSGVRSLSFGEGDVSPSLDRTNSAGKKSISGVGVGSPVENADLLYEYFPLSLDDWMPPVDAIYRPHVVHHTIVPPDLKAQQVKNKTKRYFSADD